MFRKCQYKAIGVTPSSWARRRMVRASTPSASASEMARPTTAALLSRGRWASAGDTCVTPGAGGVSAAGVR